MEDVVREITRIMAALVPDSLERHCPSNRHRYFGQFLLVILVAVSLILVPVSAADQNGPGGNTGIQWERTYGGPLTGEGHTVIRTEEGNYIATGSITGSDGKTVLYAVMTDGSGNQIWDYHGEKETYEGNSVIETADNGFVIAGSSGDRYGDGLLLLKLDSSGNKVWSNIFRIGQYGQANSVKQTGDGGFIVVGSVKSDDSSPTGWDGYILKTDDKGNEEWNRNFKGQKDDFGNDIDQLPDGSYIVMGSTESFGSGGRDLFLLNLDSAGDEAGFTTFAEQGNATGISLFQRSGGGAVLFGTSCSSTNPGSGCEAPLIRTNAQNVTLWQKSIPLSDPGAGIAAAESYSGGYLIAGFLGPGDPQGPAGDLFATAIDDAGNEVSTQTFSLEQITMVSGIAALPDGGFVITGSTGGTGSQSGMKFAIARIGTSGGNTAMAPSQTPEKNNFDLTILVREEQTGADIGQALVYLDGSAAGVTSDTDGSLLLSAVSRGQHSVRVTKDNYEEITRTVDVESDTSSTITLSPSKVTPIMVHGPVEDKIDVVFVPSETEYDGDTNQKIPVDTYTSCRTAFENDVNRLISGYLSLDSVTSQTIGLPADFRDRLNFYYYWDPDNFADAFDGCAGTLPAHFWENAPFTDVAVIVYPTYIGYYNGPPSEPNGCASGLGLGSHIWFKISADAGRLMYHENGHAMFGLVDTYCGDTYYVENDPDPNVWSSENACIASAKAGKWDASVCHQIQGMTSGSSGTCIKPFWDWDPEPDIMGNGAYSGSFGNASTTRIQYVFDSMNGGKS